MCILSGCLALTFNLRNPRTTNLHANNRFKVARYDESYIVFFDSSRWTHDLVILASRIALGEMGFNARMVLKLSAALLPFCLALSQSMQWVHWNMYLYDAPLWALSFEKIELRQWRSCADRVWTLNMNIRPLLFWSTCSRPDSATCAGLVHGHWALWAVIIANAEPRSKSAWKGLAIVFPWIVESTRKTVVHGDATLIQTGSTKHFIC